jgi:hypothetical protein
VTEDKLVMAMVPTPAHPQCGEPLSLAFTADYTGDVAPLQVEELTFTLDKGKFPENLADEFSNVDLYAPKGWDMRRNGSTFTVTPQAGTKGTIGTRGLEFAINNIIVNDEPGVTTVTIAQTVGPDKTRFEQAVTITKIFPQVAIYDMRAIPNQSIPYGSVATIKWLTSVGAVLTLEYNGKKIHHVKGKPKERLQHKGSYQTDDKLHQNTFFRLHADSAPNAVKSGRDTWQIVVPIQPPTVTLSGSVTARAGKIPKATLKWNTLSATAATLVASPSLNPQSVDVPTDKTTRDILVETTYTLSATNPVTTDAAHATQKLTPPAFNWINVGPGPAPKAARCSLSSAHGGIVMDTWDGGLKSNGIFMSPDGVNWMACTMPDKIWWQNMQMTHDGHRTYINGRGGPVEKGILFQSTTDFVTWTNLPLLPQRAPRPEDAYNYPSVPMCVDDQGAIWTFLPWPDQAVWKLPAGAENWVKIGTAPGYCTNLQWMDGKLWMIGHDGSADKIIPIYSLHSSDGITWTRIDGPNIGKGLVSIANAVHNGKICMLHIHTLDQWKPLPTAFALWRLDKNGVWTQDPAVAGVKQKFGINPTNVASIGDTLFTSGQGNFTPESGIWARNT